MKILSALILALAFATPALAQDANGAGTRIATGQASTKPGLKREGTAPKKEDATQAEANAGAPGTPASGAAAPAAKPTGK